MKLINTERIHTQEQYNEKLLTSPNKQCIES